MVLIVLSTYNGAVYLPEFLHSLQQQSHTKWKLLVRDDGSDDESLQIIEDFFHDNARQLYVVASGANIGVKASFNKLVAAALDMSECQYVMFADQDDVWKSDKISQTLSVMKRLEQEYVTVPLLVHTDLHVTDEQLNIIDTSLWHYENNNPDKDALRYLLYQNIATGCSMMLNKNLLELAFPVPEEAIMHDWWCSMVASTFGIIGTLHEATLYYRQHDINTIGAKEHRPLDIFKKTINLLLLKNEPYLLHLEAHRRQARAFLDCYGIRLRDDMAALLNFYIAMPQLSWIQKRWGLIRFGCFRQSRVQNISLFLRV